MDWHINDIRRKESGPMIDDEWLKIPTEIRQRLVTINPKVQKQLTHIEVRRDATYHPYVLSFGMDPRPFEER